MALKQPPHINGLCEFISDDTICTAVQTKLDDIRKAFEPTDVQPELNTFYITAEYNKNVAGTVLNETDMFPYINGDTVEHCLMLLDTPTEDVPPQEV